MSGLRSRISTISSCPLKPKNKFHAEDHQKKRRCKHNNRGFCKFQTLCKNLHSENICENFLQNEKCETRHPKNCCYWKKNEEGCKRGKDCQYLHINSQKYKKIEGKESDIVFSCYKCNYKVLSKINLDQHIKSAHNSIVYSCEKCDYKEENFQYLTKHKEMLHKILYSCDFCNFETKENEILASHMKSNHELSCEVCDTKFITKESLEMHMKFKHMCVHCKTQTNPDEIISSCLDCKENCCKPCVEDWVSMMNKHNGKTMKNSK